MKIVGQLIGFFSEYGQILIPIVKFIGMYWVAMKSAALYTQLFAKNTKLAAEGQEDLAKKTKKGLNVWGLLAAAVIYAAGELISFLTSTTQVEKALSEANDKVRESQAEFKILEKRLNSNRKNSDDFKEALGELNTKLSDMGMEQLKAGASSEELAEALKMVREETEKQIRLDVYKDKLKELIATQIQFEDILNETGDSLAAENLKEVNSQITLLQSHIDGLLPSYGLFNEAIKKNTEVTEENAKTVNLDLQKVIEATNNQIKERERLAEEARKKELARQKEHTKEVNEEALIAIKEREDFAIKERENYIAALDFDFEMKQEYREKNDEADQKQFEKDVERGDKTKIMLDNQAKHYQELTQLKYDAAQQFTSGIIGLLSKDEAARKKNAAIIKALSLAEIGMNLGKELSAIAYSVATSPENALTGGMYAPVAIPIMQAMAISRAAFATTQVLATKYAGGGYTGDGYGVADSTGYKQAGIVHEKEYVVPEKVIKKAPEYVKKLENIRTRGFADGGFTSRGMATQVMADVNNSKMMETILNNLPNPIVTVSAINKVQGQVVRVQERANL